MSKKPFVDFRAIRAQITMEHVLQHYGVLHAFKRSGPHLSGPCPIHHGSNPTQFRVDTDKNLWNCFSECKHGGNVLDFIAKKEDIPIHDAALKACEWFGIPIDEVENENTDTIKTIGQIQQCLARNGIVIPINNVKGELVAYAGRFPGEPPEGVPKYKLPAGFRKSQELFNFDRAFMEPKDKPLVIVEGFFDAIKLHQHGCRKMVALMGRPWAVLGTT